MKGKQVKFYCTNIESAPELYGNAQEKLCLPILGPKKIEETLHCRSSFQKLYVYSVALTSVYIPLLAKATQMGNVSLFQ